MAFSENFTTGVTNEHDTLVWHNIPGAPTVVRISITSSTSRGLLNTMNTTNDVTCPPHAKHSIIPLTATTAT